MAHLRPGDTIPDDAPLAAEQQIIQDIAALWLFETQQSRQTSRAQPG